jgi:NADPH:quinone reductase-like Zn-dependent oxidoreductase
MKAIRLQEYGDVNQFKLEDAPEPQPKAGEVAITVAASGLNPVDVFLRQGFLTQYYPMTLPAIIGIDVAGTIAAVGDGVTGLAIGDRVVAHLPINGQGGHAERAVAPVAGVAKLPATLSFEAGATLPLVGLAGRNAVNALGVKAGDRVLVSGALGGVGRVAVHYLKELGAVPVAGVRGSRLAEGKALAGEAIDIDAPAAMSFDHAVSAAGPVAAKIPAVVKDGGTVASVVQTPAEANPGDRVKIASVWAQDDPKVLQAVVDAAGRGEIRIPITQAFPLTELGEAHTALAGNPPGKIVITH